MLASGLAATSLLNGRLLMWDTGQDDLEISKWSTPTFAHCNAKLQGRLSISLCPGLRSFRKGGGSPRDDCCGTRHQSEWSWREEYLEGHFSSGPSLKGFLEHFLKCSAVPLLTRFLVSAYFSLVQLLRGQCVLAPHGFLLDLSAVVLHVCLIHSGQIGCEWGDKNSETHTSRPNFLCTSLWILRLAVWNSIHLRDGIIYSLWN